MDKPIYQATVPLIVNHQAGTEPVETALGRRLFSQLKPCTLSELGQFDERLPVLIYPCTGPLIQRVKDQFPNRVIICATFRIPKKAQESGGQFFRLPIHGAFLKQQLELLLELHSIKRQKCRLIKQIGSIKTEKGVEVPTLNLDLSRSLIIREAMSQADGKKAVAAKYLGISRQALSQSLDRSPVTGF